MEKVTTFLIEIVCPKCKRTGTAHASSHKDGDKDSASLELDQIPFGFKLMDVSASSGDLQISCDCGETFVQKRDQ